VRVNGHVVLSETTAALRDIWEETSFELDALQADPACVHSERKSLLSRRGAPSYDVSADTLTMMSGTRPTGTGRYAVGDSDVILFSVYAS